MSGSLAYQAFKLSFQISPIILTGGIATLIPGGMLPIVSITQAADFVSGLLSGGSDLVNLDDFFAHFRPMPGGSIIDQQIGKYPFANQQVAANAVIAQPLRISMLMDCPARGESSYALKLVTMLALKAALASHNASGGTYTIVTPSALYVNCVMTTMADVTPAGNKQPQSSWQLDFEQPLLTLNQVQQVQNNLMSQISNGTSLNGDPAWSGLPPTVGQAPSLATPNIAPSASNLTGAGFSGPSSL